MSRISRCVGRAVADPRVRAIVVLTLLLVVLALAWHLVGMADHSLGMIGGACLALLAAGLLILVGRTAWSAISRLAELGFPLAMPSDSPPIGRDPPWNALVLRM